VTEQSAPAAWYPDPQDPARLRYWDGIRWTEHRAPAAAPSGTTEQLTRAGQDLGDGLASAFTAAGTWFNQQTATPTTQQPPSFAQIAAGRRDEPPRHPLSRSVEALVGPAEIDPVRRVFVDARTPITPAGSTLERVPCRLVPNPWNPSDPGAVAVLVGPHQVALLPPDVATAYGPGLVALSQRRLLVTGEARLWAQYDGTAVTARVALQLPEVAALA
jgi:hypothetical protein